MSEFTRMHGIAQGDPDAASQLQALVYYELRKLAARELAGETPGRSLQPTALVHEAYLRLAGDKKEQDWAGRGHFFPADAETMRRILVERARRKAGLTRGGDRDRVDVAENLLAAPEPREDMLAPDEAGILGHQPLRCRSGVPTSWRSA